MELITQLFLTEDKDTVLDIRDSFMFERFSDDEDGTFPRVNDWTRFANRVDKLGIEAFLTFISKNNKLKIDSGYCTIIRDNQWESNAVLKFDTPIKVLVACLGGEYITKEVTELKGYFSYQWYWSSRARQNKIANILEIEFKVEL